MPKIITTDEFLELSAEDQYRYIQGMLHLEYFKDLVPEEAEEAVMGNRFLAKVKKICTNNGASYYYVSPIDCFDKRSAFKQINLFSNYLNKNFRIPKGDTKSRHAAEQAYDDRNDWSKIVSCRYCGSTDSENPLQISDVRCLGYTRDEIGKRIKDIAAEKLNLTSELDRLKRDIEEKQKEQAQLEEARIELAKLQEEQRQAAGEMEKIVEDARSELARLQEKKSQAADRMENIVAVAKDLKAMAQNYAGELAALGVPLDLEAVGAALDLRAFEAELDQETQEPASSSEESATPPAEREDLRSFARQVRESLSREDGLDYEEHVIREFLGAMRTNQIIVLSGPPGTGKSSLPQAIAKYIPDTQCRMVSVQPSWTDNQDLLGFYNPTQGCFVATPFMDILAEADKNPGTRYLVCLDEMNLVRVEYYFSELLSAMEIQEKGKKTLRLYSPFDYQRRKETCRQKFASLAEQVRQGDQGAVDACNAVCAELASLDRYPAEFPVPDNVCFVGTLNMDESTKELSPKVLDRSFIIDIRRADGTERQAESPFIALPFITSPEQTKEIASPEQKKESLHDLQKILVELESRNPHQIHAALSARGMARSEELLGQGLDLDDVFLGKILPAMKYTDLAPEKLSELIERFEAYRGRLQKGLKKLESIYDRELKELNYWG